MLIDSEILVCRLTAEELTRAGHPIGTAEVVARFAGLAEGSMVAEIERGSGRPVPPDYLDRIRARIAESYATELRAIAGVADTIRATGCGTCVASSSHPRKLELGLRSTGLWDLFGGNVVGAARVAAGKPAPDVFVYAAGWMRAPVADCLVVEDSVPGVRAAGMRAVGFVGGGHCGPGHGARLLDAGAERVIERMGELRDVAPEAFAPAGTEGGVRIAA